MAAALVIAKPHLVYLWVLVLVATLLYIVYYYFVPTPPLWEAIAWSLMGLGFGITDDVRGAGTATRPVSRP